MSTLEQLANDKINYINQNRSNFEFCWSQALPTLEALVNNPNTGSNTLEKLLAVVARIPNLRQVIALHPNTSVSLLEQLATDVNKNVRQSVAQNPKTPIALLEKLAKDSTQEVRKIAIKGYLSQEPEKLPLVLTTYIRSSKPNFTRFIIFLHKQTPAAILTKNFRSSSWLERYAIAQNSNTPCEILQQLNNDANSIVRAAARTNLLQNISSFDGI